MIPSDSILVPLIVFVAMIVAALAVQFIRGIKRTRSRILVYVPLALVLLMFGAQWLIARPKVIRQHLVAVANDLCQTGKSEHVPALGTNLQARLNSFRSPHGRLAWIAWSDASPPIGDGRATARLLLTNVAGEQLAIRFRYKGSGKFEPVGFWTPEPPGNAVSSFR